MHINKQGWLVGARHVPSPNHDERPPAVTPKLLVIHNISLPPKQYGGEAVLDFFLNKLDESQHPYFEEIAGIQVSAHLFIRRDGEVIQFVSLDKRAWHAGQSCFNGETACNNFSIGIEMEGCDDEAYTPAQYQSLVSVTESIHQHYPSITADKITGHEHIAPGRKTDPGPAFDWSQYLRALSFSSSDLKLPVAQATLEPRENNPE